VYVINVPSLRGLVAAPYSREHASGLKGAFSSGSQNDGHDQRIPEE